jgi:hypothetical protein
VVGVALMAVMAVDIIFSRLGGSTVSQSPARQYGAGNAYF